MYFIFSIVFLKKISHYCLLAGLLVFSLALKSQNLFVFDQQTGSPIDHVFVYNDQKTITGLTNDVGIIDLSIFDKEDQIHFQHPSYTDERFSMLELSTLKYRVGLNQKLIDLQEVVVSANRWESDIREVPNQIQVIRKKDITFNNPASTADMLSAEGEVYVQKSQLGGGSPMLRGFGANRILFITDGVRMNNAIYRSGNLHNILQADINMIENAEVIFGPGTNIYGSDALGGVIDFHTIKPKLVGSNRWRSSGHASVRFGSADFEKTLHTDINFGNNKWAFLASFSLSDFEDLKMGNVHNAYTQRPEYVTEINGIDSIVANDNPNKQLFSGYNQLSFISKIKQQFSKNVDWTLSFYFTRANEVPRYDRLLEKDEGQLKYAKWYYLPQQWMMNSLEMNFKQRTKMYDHATFVVAYQNVKEGRKDRKYRNDWLRQRVEHVDIFSGNADFDKALRWKNYIFYGIELVYNKVNSEGEKENIYTGEKQNVSTRYPDGGSDYFQSGAYFSYKKNFDEKPITLQAGVRFSYVYLNSVFDDTTFHPFPYSEIKINNAALSGNIGLVYRPAAWLFRFNLSTGFRAPNVDDVAKVFDSEPGNVVVPNENLQPEYLYNADIGATYTLWDVAKFEITTFFSYLNNAMVRRDYQVNGQDSIYYDGELSRVQAVQNAGYAYVYGGTFAINFGFLENFAFDSRLTLIKGFDDEGSALRHAPPLYGYSSITYEYNKLKLVASASYNTEVSWSNLAESERSKRYLYATDSNGLPYAPGWWTLNVKSSYVFSEIFLLTLGIENMLNYRYRPYSSGITAPGINIVASAVFTF